jgi:hypothetical protein
LRQIKGRNTTKAFKPSLTPLSDLTVSHDGPTPFQRMIWCSGRIDRRPIDSADIVIFLKRRNLGRGVRGIACTATNPTQSRRKIGMKIEAEELNPQRARDVTDRDSFWLVRKDGVDDDRMTLRKNANCALSESLVNLPGDLWFVRGLREPIGFVDLKKLLPQYVTSQHDGSRIRLHVRRGGSL